MDLYGHRETLKVASERPCIDPGLRAALQTYLETLTGVEPWGLGAGQNHGKQKWTSKAN